MVAIRYDSKSLFFACVYVFVCANYCITMRIFVIFAKNSNITFL